VGPRIAKLVFRKVHWDARRSQPIIQLGLLKQHPHKDSIARKRKTAALDTEFLAGASKLDQV